MAERDDMGRRPPHSLEAERAVLSACLLHGNCLDDVRVVVSPDSFYDAAHRQVFAALLGLANEGQGIDSVSVLNWLRREGRTQEVGGAATLLKLLEVQPAIARPVQHAQEVRRYHRQRSALSLARRLAAEASQPLEDLDGLLSAAADELGGLAIDSRKSRMAPLSEVMAEVSAHVTKAAKEKKLVTGVPSGYDVMDRLTTGMQPGDVSVVAGRPGMGKTAYVINCSYNEARAGYAVPFFSLEMPAIQLGLRLLSLDSRISMQHLRTGTFPPAKWPDVSAAIQRLSALPIFIDDTSYLKPADVKHRVQILQREIAQGKHAVKGMGAVKVDYLQLVVGPESRHNREEEVAQISRASKVIAKDLGVHMMLVSQLNRAPEGRKDARPTMGELRNSGAIEQDADNIILLYRDEYYHEDTIDRGIIEANLCKQRNGPTATVKLKFTKEYARFDNLAQEDDYDEFDEYGI